MKNFYSQFFTSSTCKREKRSYSNRGAVLISALVFVTVISLLLAGIGTLSVSHYARVKVDADFSDALNVAEAGANYEFNKISKLSSSADPKGNTNGVTYPFGAGSYTVYVTNRDGSVWTPGNSLYLVSKGTVNGVSRSVKISGKQYSDIVSNVYAVYGINSVSNNGNFFINGDLGSNGTIHMSGNETVTGTVYPNGPSASWSATGPATNNKVIYGANPVVWPTVDSIANGLFTGGLNYIASHNDNSMGSIVSNGGSTPLTLNISTSGNGSVNFHGKPGGANYFLQSISMSGDWVVNFDNTNGPINLWFGPSGSAGGISMSGGKSFVSPVSTPAKAVRIYVATTGGFSLRGGSEVDCSIYAYNGSTSSVSVSGNGDFNGSVIAGDVSMSGTQSVTVAGTFGIPGPVYYGYDDNFSEQNGL